MEQDTNSFVTYFMAFFTRYFKRSNKLYFNAEGKYLPCGVTGLPSGAFPGGG